MYISLNIIIILIVHRRKPKPTDIRDVKNNKEPLYDTILDNPYYKRLMQSQQVEPEGRYISARKVAGDKL